MAGDDANRVARRVRLDLGRECRVHMDVGIRRPLRRLPAQCRTGPAGVVGVVVRLVDCAGHAARRPVRVAHAHRRDGAGTGAGAGVRAQDRVPAGRVVQPAGVEHGRRLRRPVHGGRHQHGVGHRLCAGVHRADGDQQPFGPQPLQPRLLHREGMAGLAQRFGMAQRHPARDGASGFLARAGAGAVRHRGAGVLPGGGFAQQPARETADAHGRGGRGVAAVAGLHDAGATGEGCAPAATAAWRKRGRERRRDRRFGVDRQRCRLPGLDLRQERAGPGDPRPPGTNRQRDFTNHGTMEHSLDFHSAITPPNLHYAEVKPGESLTYSFVAKVPGAFLYHCGTPPVLLHIGNGMYGAIIVDPVTPLPPAAESYVLVQGEWYTQQVAGTLMAGNYEKMQAIRPDEVVFNGVAFQYVAHPLTAKPGDLVRLYVVNAGPSLWSAFHVIGGIFDKVYPGGNAAQAIDGVSTYSVGPGEGAVFDLTLDEPGSYPFVDHSMAHAVLGAQGILKITTPGETLAAPPVSKAPVDESAA